MRLLRLFSKPRNDENSRISYRDPRVKSGDDTRLGNSRILSLRNSSFFLRNSRILSLGILEFLGFFLGVWGYSFA